MVFFLESGVQRSDFFSQNGLVTELTFLHFFLFSLHGARIPTSMQPLEVSMILSLVCTFHLLLMEEIPNNHLGCIKPCIKNVTKQPPGMYKTL